ncbi:hypothetical protein D5272_19230 [bacterium D16-76]|nr:hypothetical protein [bacterium D16-76]
MDDVLLQLRQDLFSGSADGERYGVSIGQSIIPAEHPQQALADLAVRCELHVSGIVIHEQEAPGRFSDAHFHQGVVELVDVGGQLPFKRGSNFTGDFCFNHLMHLLPENRKSRSLVLEKTPATGYVFLWREGQQIIPAGPLVFLYSVAVRVHFLPESQNAVLPSVSEK